MSRGILPLIHAQLSRPHRRRACLVPRHLDWSDRRVGDRGSRDQATGRVSAVRGAADQARAVSSSSLPSPSCSTSPDLDNRHRKAKVGPGGLGEPCQQSPRHRRTTSMNATQSPATSLDISAPFFLPPQPRARRLCPASEHWRGASSFPRRSSLSVRAPEETRK